jgi:hypothetical protein
MLLNIYIVFKTSVRTAKKTPHFTVTKINRLTAVLGDNRCLLWESYETHKCRMKSYWLLKKVGHTLNGRLQKVNARSYRCNITSTSQEAETKLYRLSQREINSRATHDYVSLRDELILSFRFESPHSELLTSSGFWQCSGTRVHTVSGQRAVCVLSVRTEFILQPLV